MLPEHLVKRRGLESIISVEEARRLRAKLAEITQSSADVFWLLFKTGLRLNEGLSLRKKDLYGGEIENTALADELCRYDVQYHGYLVIESQIDRDDPECKRRKPLKSCRTISPKNSRVIPIEDKELWNRLAVGYQSATTDDTLLFEGVDDSKLNRDLAEAERALHHPHRSLHCCLHSYITQLAGRTRNFFLVRMISGHKHAANFKGYLHLFDQITLEVRRKTQKIEIVA